MKYLNIILCLILLTACKNSEKPDKEEQSLTNERKSLSDKVNYPPELLKVFETHGGLDRWKKVQTLTFEMHKEDEKELHTIDLPTRKDKIEFSEFSMGFDGTKTWILDDQKNYKGNPVFYHNVMFYFYAMPFVLADEGIVYTKTDDLVFEGKNYPGVGISFENGVGISSKDEYFIHFDIETHQMTWLGYTVSYGTGRKSDNVRWIQYKDWTSVSGVLLPKKMIWYTSEGRTLKAPRNSRVFEKIVISEIAKSNTFYKKPTDAIFIEE